MNTDRSTEEHGNPSNPEEFSLYGTSASSISRISELSEVDPQEISTMRIMHSFNLKSMQGIEEFSLIVDLNLSSNAVEKMEGLNNLVELRILNLSCNRIRKIDCLSSLKKLEKLILASNRITSFQSLSQAYGNDYSLKSLDLKDNKITSLDEIKYLGGLKHLQEVSLMLEDENNPVFEDTWAYISSFKSLANFKKLQRIDGRRLEDLLESSKENIDQNYDQSIEEDDNNREEFSEEEEDNRNNRTPLRNTYNEYRKTDKKNNSNLQLSNSQTRITENNSRLNRKETTNKKGSHPLRERTTSDNTQEREVLELERYYQSQIKGLHEKLEGLYKDQSELIHKYEMDEKYWNNKNSKLEESVRELTQDNRELNSDSMKLRVTLDNQSKEINELRKSLNEMKSKKEKKEELIDEQQKRISELLKENGDYNRELAIRMEEIGSLREEINISDARVSELKAIIRDNERRLTELHTHALQNNTINIQRSEDLQRKYEELEVQFDEKVREIRRLAEKNTELVDLVAKWEKKYEERVEEIVKSEQTKLRTIELDYREKLDELEKTHEKDLVRCDERFKENMDLLEDEFKKVLTENNEKFKQLKVAYEEKCRLLEELKQTLKVVCGKNADFERIIEDQNDMMKRMKEEYIILLQEKESKTQNNDEELTAIKAEFATLQDKVQKIQAENEMISKLNMDLEEQLVVKSREVANNKRRLTELETGEDIMKADLEKWKNRAIIAENRSEQEHKEYIQQIDDLKDNIHTKNKMLEDKNVTIEELKEQIALKQDDIEYMKTVKADTNELEEELKKERVHSEKLQKKIDKGSDYISEMKKDIGELQEELAKKDETIETLELQLEKKNQALSFIEEEIGNVKGKQDGEIKNKQRKIEELEQLLEECRHALIRKKEIQKEMEEQFRAKGDEFEKFMRVKDKEVRDLRGRLAENQEEMKFLVAEVEKERRQAKENIAKLQSIFSK